MIRSMIPLAAAMLVSCGPKGSAPTPAAEPAPVHDAAPEPMPEPAPAPPAEPNADFQASLTFAGGKSVSGHVVRVERGDDWYGERGWVDGPAIKLAVELERGSDARDAAWEEIATLSISYGSEIDCQFDSSYQPMMYMCVLRTDSKATLTDGSTWDVASRYKWRFTFGDGTAQEFYIDKLPARAQDVPRPGLNEENPDMYPPLRDQVTTEAGTGLTKVKITP